MLTSYPELEDRFAAWGRSKADRCACIVVGSRARIDPPPDEWSDLDLILFTTHPGGYAASDAWLRGFGATWLTLLDHTDNDYPEWFALYAGGIKLDVLLSRVAPSQAAWNVRQLMDASPHGAAYERGVRVLFDRADPPAAGTRIVPNSTPAAHPTREEFDRLIRKFVFDALRADKLIRRGEWWQAQASLHALRQHVLTAIEWHARVTRPDADVWYDGRFLDRWADPRAAEALPSTFAGCVPDDLRGALAAAIGTFLWVAAEVAERLGFPRLDATYGDALRWLNRLGSRP